MKFFVHERPHGIALLAVLTIITMFFVGKWTTDGIWYLSDLFHTTGPIEDIFAHFQRQGRFPLWVPELAGGYPLMGTPQTGFLYFPHILLRQFLPGLLVMNVSLYVHSLLGASGMYLLLRSSKRAPIAVAVASILFVLSGAVVGRYITANIVISYLWAPLLLYLTQTYVTSGKSRWLFYWTLAHALWIGSGHLQIVLLVAIAEAIYIAILWTTQNFSYKTVLLLIPATCLALLWNAPQITAMADLLPHTDRGRKQPVERLLDFSFTKGAAQAIIYAHPFGKDETVDSHPLFNTGGSTYTGPRNEIETAAYEGPIAVLLGLIGIFVGLRRKEPLWLLAVSLLIVGGILTGGSHSGIYRLLVESGIQRYLNIPARLYLYIHLALSIFVFYAISKLETARIRPHLRRVTTATVALAVIVPILTISWDWHRNRPWKQFANPVLADSLTTQSFVRLFSARSLVNNAPDNDFGIGVGDPIRDHFTIAQTFTTPFDSLSGIAFMASNPDPQSSRIVSLNIFEKDSHQPIRSVTIPQTAITDSDWTVASFEPIANATNKQFRLELTADKNKENAPLVFMHTNPDRQYHTGGELHICRQAKCAAVSDEHSTFDLAFIPLADTPLSYAAYDLLNPSVAAGQGVGAAQWLGPLALYNVSEYLKDMTGKEGHRLLFTTQRSLINRFPVTHIATLYHPFRSPNNIHPDGFIPQFSYPTNNMHAVVLENTGAAPRIHFAQDVISAMGPKPQRRAMQGLSPEDIQTVAADIDETHQYTVPAQPPQLIHDSSNHLIVTTRAQKESYIVIRDLFYPHWNAYIDGTPAPLVRTSSIFRGIHIPAGNHTIRISYEPQWVYPAALSCLVAMLIVGAWAGALYMREDHPQ